ncbi:MAG: redoxin domain-containing protein, partial [Gammaproteobacteria bacterium]|nr:redoxin domain-containing protein [Gammaproteobacteria bacterium]
FQDEWGPEVGSELPELTVKDTEGNDRTLEDLTGDNKGIVLFFVRTSNW